MVKSIAHIGSRVTGVYLLANVPCIYFIITRINMSVPAEPDSSTGSCLLHWHQAFAQLRLLSSHHRTQSLRTQQFYKTHIRLISILIKTKVKTKFPSVYSKGNPHLPLYTVLTGSTASAVATRSSALWRRPLTISKPSFLPTTNIRLPCGRKRDEKIDLN